MLLSDLNTKIPVTLEPGDFQAIMSGTGNKEGVIQYAKDSFTDKADKELLVFTSGAGGIFKSGILRYPRKKNDLGSRAHAWLWYL